MGFARIACTLSFDLSIHLSIQNAYVIICIFYIYHCICMYMCIFQKQVYPTNHPNKTMTWYWNDHGDDWGSTILRKHQHRCTPPHLIRALITDDHLFFFLDSFFSQFPKCPKTARYLTKKWPKTPGKWWFAHRGIKKILLFETNPSLL